MQVTPINCNSTTFYGKCSEKMEPFVKRIRNNDISTLYEQKKCVVAPIRETKLIILNNKANNIMAKLNDIMQKYFHEDTILEPQSESILTLTNTLLGCFVWQYQRQERWRSPC